MQELSDDGKRLITDEAAALALVGYVGAVQDGNFEGRHAGCFETIEAAQAWLRGESEPDFLMHYSISG